MSTQRDDEPQVDQFAELEAWAEAGDFRGVEATPALTGDEARAAGRAILEAAGLDVEGFERSRRGRPSLSANAKPGTTSPMWHVRAPEELDTQARARATVEERDFSALVRQAVEEYLTNHAAS